MEEKLSYQQKFRNALNVTVTRYLNDNPNLDRKDPFHHRQAHTILRLAGNLQITPTLLWIKVHNIADALPSLFIIFLNRLGSRVSEVLEEYPVYMLNSHFIQEQFELNLRTEASRSLEVNQLRNQSRDLQTQITTLSLQVKTLNQENQELKQLNQRLSEENLYLKEQLEKVLLSNENHQQGAINIRQSLTSEIQQLREREREHKEKLAILAEAKSEFHKTCHSLETENTELKEKNKRLAEINARLLKEKLDLQHKLAAPPQEIEMATKTGFGFFRK